MYCSRVARIRQTVAIADSTVRKVARGEVKKPSRKRSSRARKPEPEVTVTQMHPGIWREAMRLAGGKASRIQIVSKTHVVVL